MLLFQQFQDEEIRIWQNTSRKLHKSGLEALHDLWSFCDERMSFSQNIKVGRCKTGRAPLVPPAVPFPTRKGTTRKGTADDKKCKCFADWQLMDRLRIGCDCIGCFFACGTFPSTGCFFHRLLFTSFRCFSQRLGLKDQKCSFEDALRVWRNGITYREALVPISNLVGFEMGT